MNVSESGVNGLGGMGKPSPRSLPVGNRGLHLQLDTGKLRGLRLPMPPTESSTAAAAAATGTFDDLLKRAEATIDKVVDRFMATVFFHPLLQQITAGSFETDLFDGGFTEEAFQDRLNMLYADEMAASSKLSAGQVLTDHLTRWLKRQSTETVERIANHKGIDTVG